MGQHTNHCISPRQPHCYRHQNNKFSFCTVYENLSYKTVYDVKVAIFGMIKQQSMKI